MTDKFYMEKFRVYLFIISFCAGLSGIYFLYRLHEQNKTNNRNNQNFLERHEGLIKKRSAANEPLPKILVEGIADDASN